MVQEPEIVVVVVTYNGLVWIDRCLGSVADPTGRIHTVVIDNGSSDGTVEAISKRYPKVELVRTNKNLGFGQANNLGIRIALDRGSSYAFLLNQDAWLTPGTLDQLVTTSRSYPGFGILSPIHLNGKGDGLDLDFSKYIVPSRCPGLYSDLVVGRTRSSPYPLPFVNAAAWLITRECFTAVGGFSPSFFHYGEDDNYIQRVLFHGFSVGIVAGTFVHHDRPDRRLTNAFFEDKVSGSRLVTLEYSDPRDLVDPSSEKRSLIRKMIQRLLSGQRAEFRKLRDRYRQLAQVDLSQVVKNRERTLHRGTTFL